MDDRGCDCGLVCLGIVQMFLCPFLIGYIWAIITGIMTLANAYGSLEYLCLFTHFSYFYGRNCSIFHFVDMKYRIIIVVIHFYLKWK